MCVCCTAGQNPGRHGYRLQTRQQLGRPTTSSDIGSQEAQRGPASTWAGAGPLSFCLPFAPSSQPGGQVEAGTFARGAAASLGGCYSWLLAASCCRSCCCQFLPA